MNRLSTSMLTVLTLLVPTLLPAPMLAQAPENVGTGTAAIEPGDTIQDCSSGGNTCSITYPQIYCSADGENHFQNVTIPLTLFRLMRTPILGRRSIQNRRVYGLYFQKVGASTCFDRGFSTSTRGAKRS